MTRSLRSGADGVVAHKKCFAELTTPSAPFRNGTFLFMAQPPLLSEEGNTCTALYSSAYMVNPDKTLG